MFELSINPIDMTSIYVKSQAIRPTHSFSDKRQVNARLALCLASDGVLSLPIRVTMVALRSNSF